MTPNKTTATASVPAPSEPPPKPVTVKLLKEHTHERQARKPGDTLTVREGLADWLVDNGIAEVVKA